MHTGTRICPFAVSAVGLKDLQCLVSAASIALCRICGATSAVPIATVQFRIFKVLTHQNPSIDMHIHLPSLLQFLLSCLHHHNLIAT